MCEFNEQTKKREAAGAASHFMPDSFGGRASGKTEINVSQCRLICARDFFFFVFPNKLRPRPKSEQLSFSPPP